ncbi:MAG: tetratricopeptide repeat protein [Campylobacterales bacterium]|nr:tetratricopeptide repeat protein [Campylobacterales bacterium]
MENLLKSVEQLFKEKKFKEIESLFVQYINKNPDDYKGYYHLSLFLFRLGKLEDAMKVLAKALTIDPSQAGGYNNLGVILKRMKRLGGAERAYKKAIELEPNYLDSYSNLANLYRENGLYKDALNVGITSLKKDPKNPSIWINLSFTHEKLKQYQKSLECLNNALKLQPKNPEIYFHIGNLFYTVKNYEKAEILLKKAIELSPKNPNYFNNLGVMLKQQGKYKEAIVCYENSLKILPNNPNTYTNMSLALKELRDFENGLKAGMRSLEIRPNDANALNNLATVYEEKLEFEKAEEYFRKALEIEPTHPNSNWNLSVLLLKKGHYEEGFEKYEYRWQNEAAKPKPILDSKELIDEDVNGKKVYVYTEQGFGDAIQFARYLSLLDEKGGEVYLQCKKELQPLFANLKFLKQCVTDFDEVKEKMDFNVPIMSLGKYFHTTVETIPTETPYLFLKGRKLSVKTSPAKLNIGICWSASVTGAQYDEKVIDLELFKTLFSIPDTQFFSLQVGHDSDMVEKYSLENKIIDLKEKLVDFSKTASAISQMDLIVGSDTSVIHLAGALGIPSIALIPYYNDWRWKLERSDSPWYPSMKLFRQKEYMNWKPILEEVKTYIVENKKDIKRQQKKVINKRSKRRK